MHPRDELTGYGTIQHYYKTVTAKKAFNIPQFKSMKESIAAGYTVEQKVALTQEEIKFLNTLFKVLSNEKQELLISSYNKWKSTWALPELAGQSRLYLFTQSQEYKDFIDLCKTLGNPAWAFVFLKQTEDIFPAVQAMDDLTYHFHSDVLDEVHEEYRNNRYTADGVYIAPSTKANILNYIKKDDQT